MKRTSFLFFLAVVLFSVWLAFFLHSCTAGPPAAFDPVLGEVTAPPAVRVGLGRCLRDPSVRIAVRGPYEIRSGKEVLRRGDEMGWTEVTGSGGIRLGGTSFEPGPVAVVPLRDGTLEVEYVRDQRGNPVRPAAVRYHGSLLIHALAEGKLALVNEVDLEDYLKGVVGKEMNLAEGTEALKAQVIAARSYAVHEQRLERLRRVKGEKFDLYDDERSQVYGGLERETDLASRLVDATRGLFLVYEGQLVRAFYSSACGGNTEPAWEVLGEEGGRIPPLAGRKCGYCERRAIHRWETPAVIPKREIVERCLPKEFQGSRLRTLEVTRTLPGGHALELTATLEGTSKTVQLHAQDFKRGLSSVRLRSTLWDRIEDKGDTVAISGRGFGHGAGMCQVGAYEMAKDGRTAAEILEYYFPEAAVRKLY
jgi:stage II sporulation protein D